MKYYNVWVVDANRWTNTDWPIDSGCQQDIKNPHKLTLEEAKELYNYLTSYNSSNLFIVKEIPMSANEPCINTEVASLGPAINNHTCPSCKNDRCSKSEKNCWRCGNLL